MHRKLKKGLIKDCPVYLHNSEFYYFFKKMKILLERFKGIVQSLEKDIQILSQFSNKKVSNIADALYEKRDLLYYAKTKFLSFVNSPSHCSSGMLPNVPILFLSLL